MNVTAVDPKHAFSTGYLCQSRIVEIAEDADISRVVTQAHGARNPKSALVMTAIGCRPPAAHVLLGIMLKWGILHVHQ